MWRFRIHSTDMEKLRNRQLLQICVWFECLFIDIFPWKIKNNRKIFARKSCLSPTEDHVFKSFSLHFPPNGNAYSRYCHKMCDAIFQLVNELSEVLRMEVNSSFGRWNIHWIESIVRIHTKWEWHEHEPLPHFYFLLFFVVRKFHLHSNLNLTRLLSVTRCEMNAPFAQPNPAISSAPL